MKPHLDNLTPLAHAAQNRCFGCGEANPTGLQLRFFLAPDGTVVCPVSIPTSFEGPSGYLHGGIIATLLDETMSKAIRARGLIAMTRHLQIDYKRPVPSAAPIRMEGRIEKSDGRKHWVEAWIFDDKNSTLAHGKGLFIEVRSSRAVSPLPANSEAGSGEP
jgi:uncharacterized protein (TIGR00369 family)